MDAPSPNRDRPSVGEAVSRITPRQLSLVAIVAEASLAAARLALPRLPGPGLLFPVLFWPVAVFLILSWQGRPGAWRSAVRAAAPVVLASWALQALVVLLSR